MLFNVKDFGALGDGMTDDTAAIQEAIEAAAAAGGGQVYMPAGTYIVSGGEEASDGCIMLRDNVELYGDGMGQTVVKVADGSDQKITGVIRTEYGEENHDVSVHDLTIDGNRDNTTGKVDGWFNGYIPGEDGADTNITLLRVEIKDCSGYGFDPHEQTINLTIKDCAAHGNGLDGFVADYQIDGIFEGNVAYDNDRHGFNIVTSTHDFVLKDNIAYGNGGNGIVVQRGSEDIALPQDILIDGGEYYANALEGILIKLADDVTVQNAEIYGNGKVGIQLYGSDGSRLLGNDIHDNGTTSGNYAEVDLRAYDDTSGASGNFYPTQNTVIDGNTITGDGTATYGVNERADGSDYNQVTNNEISGTTRGDVLLSGAHSSDTVVPPGDPDQILDGTASADVLAGAGGNDTLHGLAGNDALNGAAGNDLLVGGAGRDTLTGGDGNDTFLFESRADSYRNYATGGVNAGDVINDFVVGQDKLDLSSLGFTGLGNGYGGTLEISTNADGSRTYVKSREADANGNRFEFSLVGNYLASLTTSSFIFQRSIQGTAGADSLSGTASADLILGNAGNDTLLGLDGSDTLVGGAGKDTLGGGSGADVFRYDDRLDSYRNYATGGINSGDTLSDFDVSQDKIDLSTLGFTGLGNGEAGTLQVVLNSDGTKTYVKSREEDANGNRFEICFEGNLLTTLKSSNFIFAPGGDTGTPDTPPAEPTAGNDSIIGLSTAEYLRGLAGNDTLDGGGGSDTLDGGAGRDVLSGGSGSDVFVFANRLDSYRNYNAGGANDGDVITDFNVSSDKIDLSGLGFTGLGDGYGGTLEISLNADGSRTYIKSREADADGNRFEFSLQGNYLSTLTAANFYFQQTLSGTAQADVLVGGDSADSIDAGAGNDTIIGGAGNDTIDGGAGRDTMTGGAGADVFTYGERLDSFRNYDVTGENGGDTIKDFDVSQDKIDLSSLGFYGLGNGYDGTLYLTTNTEGTKTYVKSAEADANGNRFEICLEGNYLNTLTASNFIFTDTSDRDILFVPTLGQSNARLLRIYGSDSESGLSELEDDLSAYTGYVVRSEIRDANGDVVDYAVGGSTVVGYTTDAAEMQERIWWYTDTDQPGPALLRAVALLQDELADLQTQGNVKFAMIWGQGENGAQDIGGASDKEAAAQLYKANTLKVFDYLKAHLDADATLYIMQTGRYQTDAAAGRGYSDAKIAGIVDGTHWVDQMQQEIAAERDDVKIAVTYDDLPMNYESDSIGLVDDVWHLSEDSREIVGQRLADFIAADLGFASDPDDNTDTVSSSVDWTLADGLHNLILTGSSAIDGIGNAADNLFFASAGDNLLDGKGGADTVSYAQASAAVSVSLALAGAAQATGGSGSDTLVGIENLAGSGYDDQLSGDAGANRLEGAAGNDSLSGGAGNDLLIGGAGGDLLSGGAGADTFRFDARTDSGTGAARDVIADFLSADGDRIDLSLIDANPVSSVDDAFTFIGGSSFSGSDATGQLRFADGVLYGSTNADASAEFEIQLVGVTELHQADLIT